MRRIALRILAVVFVIVLCLLGYGIAGRLIEANEDRSRIRSLPEFSFSTLAGEIFNSSFIESGPVIIVYYHPECEHCNYEIDALMNNLDKIVASKILLISHARRDSIISFIEDKMYHMEDHVLFLLDDSLKFSEYFLDTPVPGIFIYDEDLVLKKMYKGEVKPEAIISLLNAGD